MVRSEALDRNPPPQRWLRRLSVVSHDDSRVAETIDDSPDPYMPIEPLRLDEKVMKE